MIISFYLLIYIQEINSKGFKILKDFVVLIIMDNNLKLNHKSIKRKISSGRLKYIVALFQNTIYNIHVVNNKWCY